MWGLTFLLSREKKMHDFIIPLKEEVCSQTTSLALNFWLNCCILFFVYILSQFMAKSKQKFSKLVYAIFETIENITYIIMLC